MIIYFFRKNNYFQIILFVFAAVVLWLPVFFSPVSMPIGQKPEWIYNLIYNLLHNKPIFYTIIAFSLVIFEAIFLNYLLSELNLIPRNNFLPAFVFLLYMSSFPLWLTLHPILVANIFILLMLTILLKIKSKEEALKETFIGGLLIGISTLFCIKTGTLIFFLWTYLFIHRTYSWREWVASIIGIMAVYIYVLTVFLLSDKLKMALGYYSEYFNFESFLKPDITLSVYQYVTLILFALTAFLAVIKAITSAREKLIFIRKTTLGFIWLFFILLLTLIFKTENIFYDISLIILPLSIISSLYFLSVKKIVFAELLMIMLIISLILQRFL